MPGSNPVARVLLALSVILLPLIVSTTAARADYATTAWEARKNTMTHPHDSAAAIVTDASGNIYLAGQSGGDDSHDGAFLTVKYDPDGNVLWSVALDPTANKDEAQALTVDGAGNVYVAGGRSEGIFVTVKYDSSGNELWVAEYDQYPLEQYDSARSIAVDASGNVFVTGNSEGVGTEQDYATIKYDAAGNELWAARYDGPANGDDSPSALALDGLGNVYVTGRSEGLESADDYTTIKYDTDGNELWVARYDGTAGGSDQAAALAVTASGSVFVTGRSGSIGPPISADYATVKYDTDGNEIWVAHYDGPGSEPYDEATSLALDALGNVIVTGISAGDGTDDDYATVKYDSNGNELWVARYDGPLHAQESANAVAVNPSGQIVVTGWSQGTHGNEGYATIQYDVDGNELWAVRYDLPTGDSLAGALALDDSGNVCVTGLSNYDALTVKYDAGGTELWVDRYEGPLTDMPSRDQPVALQLDAGGNAYVTGNSSGHHSLSDALTVKYDADGNEVWSVRYNSPDNGSDGAADLALDDGGNILVTGYSMGDYATIKYDTDGNELWIARYDGVAGSGDVAVAVATDAAGNVYVTGWSTVEATWTPDPGSWDFDHDFATIKYDADGNELWVASYGSAPGVDDEPADLVVDAAGNVYVAGTSDGDHTTVKYDTDGNELWVATYDWPAYQGGFLNAITVDVSGNVYVTGNKDNGTISGSDCMTVKYDADGNELWMAMYDGLANDWDEGRALEVDALGNVHVVGSSRALTGQLQYLTIKYDTDGNELWVANYTTINKGDEAYALTLDALGDVYVAGTSVTRTDQPNGLYDTNYVTVKYDAAGNQVWTATYVGPGTFQAGFAFDDYPVSIALDGSDNVLVTGWSPADDTGDDFATLKYVQHEGEQEWTAAGSFSASTFGSTATTLSAVCNGVWLLLLPLLLLSVRIALLRGSE